MKNVFTIIICLLAIGITLYFINPTTDKITSIINNEPTLVIKPSNNYSKNKDYLFVSKTKDFVPYSYQDLLNIYYSVIDNGWTNFTFYCPEEYTECLNDATAISDDKILLTHLNNYVHPYNSFTKIKSVIDTSGEINLDIKYLYNQEEIKVIDEKVDNLIKELIKDDMEDYDKIKTIHDYIINNTKYDIERNENNNSNYNSYKAYGPLFEGYATCNGYTDLMAIFLTKLGFNNYKIATTPQEISYSATGHIWNALYYDNKWVHLDLTWDDPVSSDKKDYLFHTYFLVTTSAMHEADKGETVIEEHNFNSQYYLEFNNEKEEQ